MLLAQLTVSATVIREDKVLWFKGCYDDICAWILQCDWRSMFSECSSLDEMYECFSGICMDLITIFVPTKRQSKRCVNNQAVRHALKRKLRAHQNHKRLRDSSSLQIFKQSCIAVNEAVIEASARFERSLLDSPDNRNFLAS